MEELKALFLSLDDKYKYIFIFVYSALESIILPFPVFFLLIPILFLQPQNWIIFSALATLGSVFGAVIAWYLGKKFKNIVLISEKLQILRNLIKLNQENYKKVQELYNKYGDLFLVIAAVSPLPYKLFTWASGIFEYPIHKLIILSLIFRGILYFSQSYILINFGEGVLNTIKENSAIFGIILVLGILVWAIKHFRKV
jgi:membrane protein YqaA with SNARE-associated domain